jgi:hypothetical protein
MKWLNYKVGMKNAGEKESKKYTTKKTYKEEKEKFKGR